MKFQKIIFFFLTLFLTFNIGFAQSTAKSLSNDISWSMGQAQKQKITDLSNIDVTAGKIYKVTFYGVFSNDITSSAGLEGEFKLSGGAAGNFAGIAIGQESPTNALIEVWTVNDDTYYQQVQTDGTYGTNGTKHSMKIEFAFTCTQSGKLDLWFGHRLKFNSTLYKGSAVIVDEY